MSNTVKPEVPANQVPALKNWRGLVRRAVAEGDQGDNMCRALLMFQQRAAFQSRYARVCQSLGIPEVFQVAKEMLSDRKDPYSQAPMSLAPPAQGKPSTMTKADALLILSKREKCTHTLPPTSQVDNPSMKKYHAGKHGHYAQCLQCERKWNWNKERKCWLITQEDLLHQKVRAPVKSEKQEPKTPEKQKPEVGTSGDSSRFFSPLQRSSSGGSQGARHRGWAASNSISASRSSGSWENVPDVPMAEPVPPFPDHHPAAEEFQELEWSEEEF